MNIGIELRQVSIGSSGGMALLLKALLKTAVVQYPQHEFIIYSTFFNWDFLEITSGNLRYITLPCRFYYQKLGEQAAADGIDVLFRSYPFEESVDFPYHRQIFFLPDLQHDQFPELFDPNTLRARRKSFNEAMARAAAIGTLSEFAAQTIREHPWNRCKDIFLIPPALEKTRQQAAQDLTPEEKTQIPAAPFFYFPANLWPHKNHRRILKAFELFLEKHGQPFELVLSGHPAGWAELRAEFPDLPVRHLGFVSPQQVTQLFKRATALIFFTLYEGFGIPLLEAFDAGIPVLCSNTTSLPEVGGDAILTCDPNDIAAMSCLMERICTDTALRKEMTRKGKLRLAQYSWEQSAQNLIAACERVHALKEEIYTDVNPLVTIVTPSYNQAEFLKRTIESVLHQTYQNIEYIVMDGGSSDGSVDILKSYGDRFFWRSEKDHGQTEAINKGLVMAHGSVLAYLNSDDVLLPDSVEKAVRYFVEHAECDMVYGLADYINEHDEIIGHYRTDDYSFSRIVAENCVCQPAAFWRTRLVPRIGLLDETYYMAMDHDYWMRIDRAGGNIQHTHQLLAYSRLHESAKTITSREISYKEVFKASMKYAGTIHVSYLVGYWHYRVWEQKAGWAHELRRIPHSFTVLGYLNWYWNQRRQIPQLIASFFRHRLLPALSRRMKFLRSLALGLGSWIYTVNPQRAVNGVFPDNYLAPVVQIYLKHWTPGKSYRLSGRALVDTELEIQSGNHKIARYSLKGGELKTMEITPTQDARVRLLFSKDQLRGDGYTASFIMDGTDLFTEQEAFG